MKPFIIWVGGKTRSRKKIIESFPEDFNKYYEPFIGGGSIFMELGHPNAHLTDVNPQLINCYKKVKTQPKKFVLEINKTLDAYNRKRTLESKKKYYNQLRKEYNEYILKKPTFRSAVLFVFLGRAGFNGLYRVNKKGIYNTPFGQHMTLRKLCYNKKNPGNCIDIYELHKYLNKPNVKIEQGDYMDILKLVKKKDLVYLDPPYFPIKAMKTNFTSYVTGSWGLDEHMRFFDFIRKLTKKGCYVVMSNNNSPFLKKQLPKPQYNYSYIETLRSIGAKASVKKNIKEILIKNY